MIEEYFPHAPEAGSVVIAQCRTPHSSTLLPITGEEIDRLRNWLTWQLRPFNLPPGGSVLQIFSTGATWPMASLQKALLDGTLLPTFAETSSFDWYRVAAILRQFPLVGVFGLNGPIIAALEEYSPDSLELLRKVPVIFAEPDAKNRLMELGILSYGMLNLGATLAIECPLRLGLHIDGREWKACTVDGEIQLTSLLPRIHPFTDFATGIHGRVEKGPCGCGSPDWRLLV